MWMKLEEVQKEVNNDRSFVSFEEYLKKALYGKLESDQKPEGFM